MTSASKTPSKNPESRSEIKDTQKEIEEIKGIMQENIEKVLQSGVKLNEFSGTVEAQRIEAVNLNENAKRTYLSAANSNYGVGLISIFGCIGASLSLITQQPWPFHIMMFAIFGAIGYAVNQVRNKIHGAWLRAKLFGESVLPSKQAPEHNHMSLELNPTFTPAAISDSSPNHPTPSNGLLSGLSYKLGI